MSIVSRKGIVLFLVLIAATTIIFVRRGVLRVGGKAAEGSPRTLVSARVPGHGVIYYRERFCNATWMYEYSVRWAVTPKNALDYLVWAGGNPLSRKAEIRATADYSGIWIVARNEGNCNQAGHVVASLDTVRRVFIGENGLVMDPALPLEEQERAAHAKAQLGHPKWATVDGGVVLARGRAKR